MQLVPEILNNVIMTSRCHVMTSWYASRWRLHYFRIPWPLKHRIQKKNDVIRACSHGDIRFNQPIHLSLVTTCALVFSLRRGKVNLVTVHRWRNCKSDTADHVYRTWGVSYGWHRRQGFPQDFLVHTLVAHLKNKSFARITDDRLTSQCKLYAVNDSFRLKLIQF